MTNVHENQRTNDKIDDYAFEFAVVANHRVSSCHSQALQSWYIDFAIRSSSGKMQIVFLGVHLAVFNHLKREKQSNSVSVI